MGQDDSGDLQGVKEGEGGDAPSADLPAMYMNYLRGCGIDCNSYYYIFSFVHI